MITDPLGKFRLVDLAGSGGDSAPQVVDDEILDGLNGRLGIPLRAIGHLVHGQHVEQLSRGRDATGEIRLDEIIQDPLWGDLEPAPVGGLENGFGDPFQIGRLELGRGIFSCLGELFLDPWDFLERFVDGLFQAIQVTPEDIVTGCIRRANSVAQGTPGLVEDFHRILAGGQPVFRPRLHEIDWVHGTRIGDTNHCVHFVREFLHHPVEWGGGHSDVFVRERVEPFRDLAAQAALPEQFPGERRRRFRRPRPGGQRGVDSPPGPCNLGPLTPGEIRLLPRDSVSSFRADARCLRSGVSIPPGHFFCGLSDPLPTLPVRGVHRFFPNGGSFVEEPGHVIPDTLGRGAEGAGRPFRGKQRLDRGQVLFGPPAILIPYVRIKASEITFRRRDGRGIKDRTGADGQDARLLQMFGEIAPNGLQRTTGFFCDPLRRRFPCLLQIPGQQALDALPRLGTYLPGSGASHLENRIRQRSLPGVSQPLTHSSGIIHPG